MSIVKPDDLKAAAIVAWRYYAFLEVEKRFLRHELLPGWMPGDRVLVPCDLQVGSNCLERNQDSWVKDPGLND